MRHQQQPAIFFFMKIVLACLPFVLQLPVSANPKIDSLYNALKKADDRRNVDIYNQLSGLYLKISLDTAVLLAEKALSMAEEIRCDDGKAAAFLKKGEEHALDGKYEIAREAILPALDITGEITGGALRGFDLDAQPRRG